MRDIPVFATENGVASLILKKIPYTKDAYVHIHDSCACEELLKECVDLCRMAGAQRVFATGYTELATYPLHCSELCFSCSKAHLPNTDALALPVTVEQRQWWRRIYNQKMTNVPAAAPLSEKDVEEMAEAGKAFCVYRECSMLGIGVAHGGRIYAVVSLLPKAGESVVLALSDVLDSPLVCLSVASTNEKAIMLYHSLGFTETAVEKKWYQIY